MMFAKKTEADLKVEAKAYANKQNYLALTRKEQQKHNQKRIFANLQHRKRTPLEGTPWSKQTYDWFRKAFGFKECSGEIGHINYICKYDKIRENLLSKITPKLSNSDDIINSDINFQINGINMGHFAIFNRYVYNQKIILPFYKGITKNKNIVNITNSKADIIDIHTEVSTYDTRATIQVASQLNCLEMVNENISPEMGITIYARDKTQGPLCAMTTPAGLAFRNYLYNGIGQKDKQINLLDSFINEIKSKNKQINIYVKNGYLLFGGVNDVIETNIVLKDKEFRKNIFNFIASGSHTGLGVCINGKKYLNTINHVYCSGIPVNIEYHPDQTQIRDANSFDGISETLLYQMYLNTLLISCINNYHNKTPEAPCYLTQIGGGAFGMKHEIISNMIMRACNQIARIGLSLNVIILHKEKNPDYLHLYTKVANDYSQYNFHTPSESIWENKNFLDKYAS